MKKWYMVIDVARCENCNNCFLSCKDEYVGNEWPSYSKPQPDKGPAWIEILSQERGIYPFIDVAYMPLLCMHCRDAACIKAAKNGEVYSRPDGIVLIHPEKAKGKMEILKSCPYGAIRWNEAENLPQKCTLCAHLLDSGWTKTRCVQACPTGALSILNLTEEEMKKMVEKEGLERYRPELKRDTAVFYKNLNRFTKCFIGGSLATFIDGKEECVEGGVIRLFRGKEKMAEITTDFYGDFKFEGIDENSGKYTIEIEYKAKVMKILEIEMKKSIYLGVIYI